MSGHVPILPLLRALGRHGADWEKATDHADSLSSAKIGRCSGLASRSAVRVRASARKRKAEATGKSTAMPGLVGPASREAHGGRNTSGADRVP